MTAHRRAPADAEMVRLSRQTTTAKGDAAARTAQHGPHVPGRCRRDPSAMPCDTCAATQVAQPGFHRSAPIICNVPCCPGHPTRRKLSVTAGSARIPQNAYLSSPRGAGCVYRTTLLAATASGESPCRSTAESLPALAVSAEESVLFLMLPSILLLRPFMDFILGGGAMRPDHSGEGV